MDNEAGYDAGEKKELSPSIIHGNSHEDDIAGDSSLRSPRNGVLTRLSWVILCSSMLLAELQAALDSTITADVQPAIIHTFGDIQKLPWVNVTYSLGLGGSCLLWGKLVTLFDSKKVLLVSRVLFAAGSALTAAGPSMNSFIIGKTVTGFGSCGSYISIINIITVFTAPHERGRYFGYIGFVWGLGTMTLIGGAFVDTAPGWRWAFYFNLLLVGVTFPVFIFVLPSSKMSPAPLRLWTCIRRVDLVGFVLFAGALCSGIMAVSFGGAVYAWNSGTVIGLLCCSGALWLVFTAQQVTTSFTTEEDRILPLHVLHSWEMWILIMQTGCAISLIFITIFYIPLYFQFVRGETTIQAAVNLLPFLFTTAFATLISGRLISNYGYYKIWFVAGSTLALIMSICFYTTEIESSHGKIYGYLIIGGVGTGLYAMNAGPVMSAITTKEHVADASTVFGCVDTLCGAIAVAIANSIFINQATNSIQKLLPDTPRATVQDAIAGTGASLTTQLPPELRQQVLQALLMAVKDAWIQMIATATPSLILSLFLRRRKLSDLSN